MECMGDPDLIYGLEGRLMDLEAKVALLEKQLADMAAAPSTLPQAVQNRIESGEHPVRVLREFRLLTQSQLSEKCGIRPNHISAIERGQTFGLKTAKRLAAALDVPAEVLF